MSKSKRVDEVAFLAPLAPLAAGTARVAGSVASGVARVGAGAAKAASKAVKAYAKKRAMKKAKEKLIGKNNDPQVDQALEQEMGMEEACWKGYTQKGMKTMFGKQYPNCVKKKKKLKENMENLSEEGLRAWFGNSKSKGGKPGWVQVVSGKPCARQPGQKSTPKCVSSSKRASMTPAQRRSAQARKRKADPNQRFKTGAAKPTYVPTDKPKKKAKGKKK